MVEGATDQEELMGADGSCQTPVAEMELLPPLETRQLFERSSCLSSRNIQADPGSIEESFAAEGIDSRSPCCANRYENNLHSARDPSSAIGIGKSDGSGKK